MFAIHLQNRQLGSGHMDPVMISKADIPPRYIFTGKFRLFLRLEELINLK